MTVRYPYEHGQPLQERFVYAYVPYQGPAFVDAWRDARSRARADLGLRGENAAPRPPTGVGALDQRERAGDPSAGAAIDRIFRRFEVSGRVAAAFDESGRPLAGPADDELEPFIDVAVVAERRYRDERTLTYLNVLVKALDIVCALRFDIPGDRAADVLALIDAERVHVTGLVRTDER